MAENKISNEDTILLILKSRLGISTDKRDTYLHKIIESIQSELNNQMRLNLDYGRADVQVFIADYAEYRYSNRDNPVLPQHLRWRLHNLAISSISGGV